MDGTYKKNIEQLMTSKGFIPAEITRFLAQPEFNKTLPEIEEYLNSDLVKNMFSARLDWLEKQKARGVTAEGINKYLTDQLKPKTPEKVTIPSVISKDESIECQTGAKIIADLIIADKAKDWEIAIFENWLKYTFRRYAK